MNKSALLTLSLLPLSGFLHQASANIMDMGMHLDGDTNRYRIGMFWGLEDESRLSDETTIKLAYPDGETISEVPRPFTDGFNIRWPDLSFADAKDHFDTNGPDESPWRFQIDWNGDGFNPATDSEYSFTFDGSEVSEGAFPLAPDIIAPSTGDNISSGTGAFILWGPNAADANAEILELRLSDDQGNIFLSRASDDDEEPLNLTDTGFQLPLFPDGIYDITVRYLVSAPSPPGDLQLTSGTAVSWEESKPHLDLVSEDTNRFAISETPPAVGEEALIGIESAIQILFNSEEGETYVLQSSTDLIFWFDVEEIIGTGGEIVRYFDPTQPKTYYRVLTNIEP